MLSDNPTHNMECNTMSNTLPKLPKAAAKPISKAERLRRNKLAAFKKAQKRASDLLAGGADMSQKGFADRVNSYRKTFDNVLAQGQAISVLIEKQVGDPLWFNWTPENSTGDNRRAHWAWMEAVRVDTEMRAALEGKNSVLYWASIKTAGRSLVLVTPPREAQPIEKQIKGKINAIYTKMAKNADLPDEQLPLMIKMGELLAMCGVDISKIG